MMMKFTFFFCFLFILFFSIPKTLHAAPVIDLSSSANYNFRFGNGTIVNNVTTYMSDINGDNKKDMTINIRDDGSGNSYFYIIYNDLVQTFHSGEDIDLLQSANYNIRFKSVTPAEIGTWNATIGDFDNDNKGDLAITDSGAGSAGRGAIYVIKNPIFGSLTGTGHTFELSQSTSYSVRIDQVATANNHYGVIVRAEDLNGNGTDDLLIGDDFALFTTNHSGSLYVIYDDLLSSYSSGTGNVVSIDTTTTYNIRFDGPPLSGGPNLTNGDFQVVDLNADGDKDLVIGCWNCSYNSRSLSGSVYVIYSTLIDTYTGTGNTVALGTSTNYNIRFDGALASDDFGKTIDVVDFDSSGDLDLVISSLNAGNNSRASSGSVYGIKHALFGSLAGTGNTVDMATTSNWTFRFDGATAGDKLGHRTATGDFDGDTKVDFAFGAPDTDFNGRADSGSIYVIYNPLFGSITGTNNTIDLSDSSKYSIRYDGPSASSKLSGFAPFTTRIEMQMSDLNNDNKPDLMMSHYLASYVGAVTVVLNFPHTIVETNFPTNNIGSSFGFQGVVNATDSTTTISGVEYQLNSNNPSGSWTSCTAVDGAFDEKTEQYFCHITGLSGQTYTLYARAYDSNGSYTAQSQYLTKNFTPFGPYVSSPDVGGSNSYRCNTSMPEGNVELFQTNTTATTAKLFFTPASSNVSGYAIIYGYKENDERFSATFDQGQSSGVLSYTINELTPNTQYSFKVVPLNGCMGGTSSNWLTGKTTSKGAQPKPFYLHK